MARSESQGLQIALILFVMISVVLAVLTFVYYRQTGEAEKRVVAAETKEKAAVSNFGIEQFKVQYLKHVIGAAILPDSELEPVKQSISGDPSMKSVMDTYDTTMSTFAQGLPPEKKTYTDLLPHLLNALRGQNLNNINLTVAAKSADDLKNETERREKERTETAITKQQESEANRDTELAMYNADRQKIEQEKSNQLAQFTKERGNLQASIAKEQKAAEDLTKTVDKQQVTIDSQVREIRNLQNEPFEVAHGQVTTVNQELGTLWINLGLADGLRRQTIFSVYDQGDNGVTRTKPKSAIEVTRVLDQHLAEARIVGDEPGNPILPGDQVFSPAWKPGRRVHFALAGNIDIDNDGRSDRNLVRSLLTASGAAIDCEMHDDGTIEGEMTPGTRYFVRGTEPTERNDAAVLASWGSMINAAAENGVETISVEKLLPWMGYRTEVRTVGLGKNADSSQFLSRPPEGKAPTSSGTVSELFRERQPPARSKENSTFK